MVQVRDDYSAAELRRLAEAARTTAASRRMLSLALILEGAKRADAAKAGGMDRQTLRDWVHRCNAEGPEGLYSKPGTGPSCRLNEAQQQELVAIIEAGPDLAKHGVVRFRLCDLCALVEERFGVTYERRGLSKLIRRLGFRKISARPEHPRSDPEIQAEYKKIPGSGPNPGLQPHRGEDPAWQARPSAFEACRRRRRRQQQSR